MKLLAKKYLFIVLTVISISNVNAQTFGFGCLGLSGFYAGYSKQSFDFPGINQDVNKRIQSNIYLQSSNVDQLKFEILTGYRVGANLFRAKFSSVFISAKGYFQFLKQQQQVSTQIQNEIVRQSYQVSMNHWGVGLDFGTSLFSILDWKIIEGHVLVYTVEMTQEVFINEVSQGQIKFSPDKAQLGYYVGSGLILHIVPDYISIEGTAGYNFIQIDKLNNSAEGSIPVQTIDQKAIDKGNFSITLQINIGFPL
jgi:hypothetical protein